MAMMTLEESFDRLVQSGPSWILHDPELPTMLQHARKTAYHDTLVQHPGRSSAPHPRRPVPTATIADFKEVNAEWLDGLPEEQRTKSFLTLVLMGHILQPDSVLQALEATPAITKEEQDQHDALMIMMGESFEKGMSVSDTHEACLVAGLLEKRNGDPFSLSTFHKWARVVKMRTAHVKSIGRFRMTKAAKDRLEELVRLGESCKDIYYILQKGGHLERPSGGIPFGFIAIRDRVGRAKRKFGLYCTSGLRVKQLYDMGKTEKEICKELKIDHKQYYSHAVRQGIIIPKSKQEK